MNSSERSDPTGQPINRRRLPRATTLSNHRAEFKWDIDFHQAELKAIQNRQERMGYGIKFRNNHR